MLKAYDNFIKLAIKKLRRDMLSFSELKKNICFELKLPMPPTNANLREHYEKLVAQKIIQRNSRLEKILMSRKIRTQSGVAVVAVLTKSYPCPGKCLYCPTEKDMPKSYLSNEPAVMRAISAKFSPYRQVQSRLRSLELNGHQTDKIELIVMGGTFSALPHHYQKWFIYHCFKACNEYGKKIKNKNEKIKIKENLLDNYLLKEQKKNERTKQRVIGLTLETRPDFIDEAEIVNFRHLGATRVELGVQSLFDDILQKNRRGHGVAETIHATKLLKDAGFKINYHMMPGLPGSNLKKDFLMFQKLFSECAFQPDMLKIYPTIVTKNSALYKLWQKGEYRPLTDSQFKKLILKIKKDAIPPYVRLARLVRDVPATSIVAGPKISNLRQLIAPESFCRCIRCREVRADYNIRERVLLNRIDYYASDGKEIFLQFVSPDKKKLFALLRLRIPSSTCHPELVEGSNKLDSLPCRQAGSTSPAKAGCAQNDKLYSLIPALRNAAVIREVHTYGQLTQINKKDKKSPQHFGLGKKLMAEAEKIARQEFGLRKIAVISGVGAREYYRKLGYSQKNGYMVKSI